MFDAGSFRGEKALTECAKGSYKQYADMIAGPGEACQSQKRI